jgi:photosystem II stability/assembly factor-like uncharacterized protein
MTDVLKSTLSALWLQLDGANTEPELLACHQLEDVEEPAAEFEPIRCRKIDGSAWRNIGQRESPPGNVTTTIEVPLFVQRDLIEQITTWGVANLYIMHRDQGPADVFANYKRGQILHRIRKVSRTFSQMHQREEDNESLVQVAIVADDMFDVDPLTIQRIATTEVLALNDVWSNQTSRMLGARVQDAGDLAYIACDSAVGPATANILGSINQGITFAALAADPFGAGLHAQGIVRFQIDSTTFRLLAAKQGGVGAAQGQVAYSDNNGAAWTVVSVGGAALDHGAVYPGGLFALDMHNIWLAGDDGFIYKSTDGGETWTAVESAGITAGDYNQVHFSDQYYGVSGAAADIIALTSDGGLTWQAGTATGGAGNILTVQRLDAYRLWAGDDAGRLYYSEDNGITWTQRTGWTGSGVGDIRDLYFINELQGFMVYNSAAPLGAILRTNDGGFTWESVTTPVLNAGLNRIFAVSPKLAYAVGEAQGGTGVIMKVSAANLP